MTYYNSGGSGGYFHYNNNKLQLDLALNQKLDFLTKGLAMKLKGSYNNMFNVTKEGLAQRATYFPVIQDDGSILYRKDGENTPVTYSESTGRAGRAKAEAGSGAAADQKHQPPHHPPGDDPQLRSHGGGTAARAAALPLSALLSPDIHLPETSG